MIIHQVVAATNAADNENRTAEANMPACPGRTMAMGTDKVAHAGDAKELATNDTATLNATMDEVETGNGRYS